MTATDLLHKIGETLGSTATVKSVFGEAIHVNGKTVVPVAKVTYGFGGGLAFRRTAVEQAAVRFAEGGTPVDARSSPVVPEAELPGPLRA